MGWRYMWLRGSRVLARCQESGELLVKDHRVEIRYQRTGGRTYRAGVRNLVPDADETVHPLDYCEGEEAAPPPTAEEASVVVYVDGASKGNPGAAGLGVVLIEQDKRRELSEYLGEATNNVAELTAILRAANAISDPTAAVRVYTDSKYSIGVLTQGWKAKKNGELIADVKDALARLDDVRLIHVPGHSGVPLNERADELASQAARTRRSTGWVSLGG